LVCKKAYQSIYFYVFVKMWDIILKIRAGIMLVLCMTILVWAIANLVYQIKFSIDEYKWEKDREKREEEERERCKAEWRPYYWYMPGCCVAVEIDYTKYQGGNN